MGFPHGLRHFFGWHLPGPLRQPRQELVEARADEQKAQEMAQAKHAKGGENQARCWMKDGWKDFSGKAWEKLCESKIYDSFHLNK